MRLVFLKRDSCKASDNCKSNLPFSPQVQDLINMKIAFLTFIYAVFRLSCLMKAVESKSSFLCVYSSIEDG